MNEIKEGIVDLSKIPDWHRQMVKKRLEDAGLPVEDRDIWRVFEKEARDRAEYEDAQHKRCEALPIEEGIWVLRLDPDSDNDVEISGNDVGIIYVENAKDLREHAIALMVLADKAEAAGF
jgi:hypothetical protein